MTTVLPDGTAFDTISLPLPADHWLTAKRVPDAPPMPFRMGTADPRRPEFNQLVTQAARYAIRAATMNGRSTPDTDAIVQNFIVGMLGYHTPDGLCHDPHCPEFDPNPAPPHYPGFEP